MTPVQAVHVQRPARPLRSVPRWPPRATITVFDDDLVLYAVGTAARFNLANVIRCLRDNVGLLTVVIGVSTPDGRWKYWNERRLRSVETQLRVVLAIDVERQLPRLGSERPGCDVDYMWRLQL